MGWFYDAENGLIMQKMDRLCRSGIINEVDFFLDIYQLDLCHSLIQRPFVKFFVKAPALGNLQLHKNLRSEKLK